MRKALLMGGILLTGFIAGLTVGAQTTEVPVEDLEVIEMLELLENLDFLKEDLELIKTVGLGGEEYGS
jgi:hypothetical protein